MPAERLPMRKVREVLRLKHACGASERLIAQSLGIGRTTVGEYLRRAAVIGITWPVEVDDAELERRRSEWPQPGPRYASGVFAKYAATVGSASFGART